MDELIEKFSWDKKLGMINVASTVMTEREWHIVLPPSVSFHVSRICLDGAEATEDKILAMAESDQVERAAAELASSEVDVITFTCTSGSFLKGLGWDTALCDRISQAAPDTAVMTTSTGLIEAFRFLNITSINMATPYFDTINEKEKTFIEGHSVKVRNFMGEQCRYDQEIGKIAPERFIEMQMEMYEKSPDVDALFISCTNSRTIEAIPVLEKLTGKPVLSSNQVTLWSALRKCGYEKPISGYGKLLEML